MKLGENWCRHKGTITNSLQPSYLRHLTRLFWPLWIVQNSLKTWQATKYTFPSLTPLNPCNSEKLVFVQLLHNFPKHQTNTWLIQTPISKLHNIYEKQHRLLWTNIDFLYIHPSIGYSIRPKMQSNITSNTTQTPKTLGQQINFQENKDSAIGFHLYGPVTIKSENPCF